LSHHAIANYKPVILVLICQLDMLLCHKVNLVNT